MMNKTITLGVAVLAALPLMAIRGTISTDNDSKTGDLRWVPASKSYDLTYKKGNNNVSVEYKLADVTNIDVDKPATLAKAIELVEKGQGVAAIASLQKIVTDYRMLVWDKVAGRYLVKAYLDAGQAQKAMELCNTMLIDDKTAAWKGDLAPAYWQTLLKLGKREKLEDTIKKAIASGGRIGSAQAQLMRGDIILSEGESAEVFKRALREGYLRVVLMYRDPECAQVRREAMLKAADCFDRLNYAQRAEKLRAQAKTIES